MPPADPMPLLSIVFLGFGLLFLTIGVTTVVVDRRRRATWRVCPGEVVGTRLDDGQFRFQVAYRHDGRDFTFWNRFTSTAKSDPVGRAVEVLVNPDDPADAVVSRGPVVTPGAQPLVSGTLVGSVFAAFGVLAIMVGMLTGTAGTFLVG